MSSHHQTIIQRCELRAAASLAQASFIAERLDHFYLICPHSSIESPYTGVIQPHIHIFSEKGAKEEFGSEGWIETDKERRLGMFEKVVDGMLLSYDDMYDGGHLKPVKGSSRDDLQSSTK